MATTKTNTKMLGDLFLDTLKDIYFAEEQILKALPKMDRAAKSELALQLRKSLYSESIGLHDSEVMDGRCINRDDA